MAADNCIYKVTVDGDNNSFQLEVTVEYEALEDWLTGRVRYRTHVDTAMLVHGNRRRDVTSMLTERQREQITNEVDQQNLLDY